jgi:WD40 repeat protein/transcriptional regulator with XRE-family HTH domain
VQRFAYELRKLRQDARGLTYREMARRAHYSVTALSQAAAGEQLPSLAVALAYVKACGGDLEEWERRWKEASEQAASRNAEDEAGRSPYQGLARFEPDDHDRFFGRDELLVTLRRMAGAHRFSAVFGPSGSGKSSLLRAGLIPALREHSAGRVAAIRILTPGEHPLRTHAGALEPKDADGDTLIVVDQFEEVFTVCRDAAQRTEFINRLLAAREPDSRLRVVIAVRADFYGHLAEHRALAEAVSAASLLVGPMSAAELREVIVKPAQRAGLIVERELTARLVREVEGEPGGLPLLSHVLHETWRRRRGRALTVQAYEAAGGLHGAIAQTAEDVHTGLSAAQAELARTVLLRLISPGEGSADTRRPATRSELDLAERRDDTGVVLDRLVRARLITIGEDTVELAHEAVITAWPRLRGWIEEDRERLRAHRRLTEAARAWDDLGRDPGALYRGIRLETADAVFGAAAHAAALTPLERSFLDAGRGARTRERRRRHGIVTALAALMAIALVAGLVAWQEGRTSDRRKLEAEARRIAAIADSMRFSDPVKAMRLSVAAWRLAQTPETRSALLGAVTQKEEDVFTLPDTGGAGAVRHLTADGRTLMTIAPHRIVTWDVRTHRRMHTYPGIGRLPADDDLEDATRVSPDGRTIALLQQNSVQLWDVRAGRVTGQVRSEGWPEGVVFDPDGRTLVVAGHAIEAWDLRRGRRLLRIPLAQNDNVQDMVVSADGRLLAVCGDGPLRIWNIPERRKVHLPPSAESASSSSCRPRTFDFNPAGDRLSLATDTEIRTWELSSGRELPELQVESAEMLRFSADGAFLAVTTGTDEIQLWRAPARQEEVTPEEPVFRYLLQSESSYELRVDLAQGVLRYGSWTGTTVRSLDVASAMKGRWQTNPTSEAQWSDGARALAIVRDAGGRRRFQVLDGRTGRVLSTLPGAACPGWGVCTELMSFSADGRYLAYGPVWSDYSPEAPPHQRITVWDVANRRRHATLDLPQVNEKGSQPGISSIALGAGGRALAVARTRPDTLELWHIRQARRLRTVPGFLGPYDGTELAFRSDGGKVVSVEDSVADLHSGRARRLTLGDEQTAAVTFSKDGRYLAAGDVRGRVTIWDGNLRQRLGVLAGTNTAGRYGYAQSVTALAFSPDNSLLAVADGYNTVQIWDTVSNRAHGSPLPTPGDPVLALAFGSSGDTLHIAGAHVLPNKYDLSPAHLVKQACRRAGGGLPEAEWQAYLPTLPYRRTC